MAPRLSIALIVAALAHGTAVADVGASDDEGPIAAAPPNFPGSTVDVIEHTGEVIPLDVPLRDQDGRDTTLRELVAGELPTILTFNYSSCPNLCSFQLNGLVQVLPKLPFRLGQQFKIVTIVLDPKEELSRAAATRTRYTASLPEGSDASAWTFAATRTLGDGAAIQQIAEAVGFKTQFVTASASWAHPAALVFLSTHGRVIRYVHGVDYDKDVMIESIMKAGTGDPLAAAGFLMRCFHWDPSANDYSRAGSAMLRYAAAGFLVLILSIYGAYHLLRRQRARALGARP
jgi:protein SCO1